MDFVNVKDHALFVFPFVATIPSISVPEFTVWCYSWKCNCNEGFEEVCNSIMLPQLFCGSFVYEKPHIDIRAYVIIICKWCL